MSYIKVADVRTYNRWYPIKVVNETLERIGDAVFRTVNRPLVDGDMDGEILDDVKAYVDGAEEVVTSVDPEKGEVTLSTPPPPSSLVTATYYWHPVGDGEISLAIKTAEAAIEAATGMRFSQHLRRERIKLYSGSDVVLSHPVISVEGVRVIGGSGVVDASPSYEVIDHEHGVVRLRGYVAGSVSSPWYLPAVYEVEVVYQAGYPTVPDSVKQACVLMASYWLLLRAAGQLVYGEDYGYGVSAGFKTEELEGRIKLLRSELDRILEALPKRVERG